MWCGNGDMKNGSVKTGLLNVCWVIIEVEDDQVKSIIDNDRHSTTREKTEKLNVFHKYIEHHIKHIQKKQQCLSYQPK